MLHVVRKVDHGHTASTQLALDGVVPERPAGHGRGLSHT
jgi:hypothetical protein